MKTTWYSRRWVIVLLHILCWTVVFSLPFLLRPSYENQKPVAHSSELAARFFVQYIINCFTWILLFYLNAYWLLPKFFYRKKHGQYVMVLIAVVIALFFVNWITFQVVLPQSVFQIRGLLLFYFFPCLFMIASSTAFIMFRDKVKSDNEMAQKETLNLKTELSFLRSQVSPHFMFNVLNNMVALARKGSDQLEPSLIKLSSLLRYMLYETDEEKVPLDKEVEYLQSYIDLQNQRFGKKVKTSVSLNHIDGNYFIEPMLLIPFVENAFKHGTGLIEDAEINIELTVKNGLLNFLVRNKFEDNLEIKDKTSGIGLANAKRRLNLLYKDQHTLLINKKEGKFMVSLQINLH